MPLAPHDAASPLISARRTRLDSWKEIADYLAKGERTAKRWESERSLPIHHVPGHGHGSVYAFTAELDEWLLSRKAGGLASSQEIASQSENGPSPDRPAAEASADASNLRPS